MHLRLYLILMCFGVGGLLLFGLFRKTTAPQPSFETVDDLAEFESGPGALWMLLNHHGVHVSLEQLRLLTDVSRDVSVTGDDLQRAANHLGVVLKPSEIAFYQLSLQAYLPCLLRRASGRFVLVYARNLWGDRLFLADPIEGLVWVEKETLRAEWEKIEAFEVILDGDEKP